MKASGYKNKKGGFIAYIIIILIALIAVKFYYHFDIVQWIQSPGPQKYIQEVWTWIKFVYNWLDTTVTGLLKKYVTKS